MTKAPGERGTNLFIISLRQSGSTDSPRWRCRVRHVSSGSAALVLDVQGLASFINACVGASAFPEAVAGEQRREQAKESE